MTNEQRARVSLILGFLESASAAQIAKAIFGNPATDEQIAEVKSQLGELVKSGRAKSSKDGRMFKAVPLDEPVREITYEEPSGEALYERGLREILGNQS